MPALATSLSLADRFGRPLRSLRISVTDRCNLRCRYCMPEEQYVWLPRHQLLRFEEICELTSLLTELGVERVRLTGGEPLLRKDLPVLVRMLAANPRIRDLALTTNGVLLGEQAQALRDAGLGRITLSLDTLRPERFTALTRRNMHSAVLAGIKAAQSAGFHGIKIDTVVMRGANDDELSDLIEFGREAQAEVRFIEYMDVGGATRWAMEQVVAREEILKQLRSRYGTITPIPSASSAPAEEFLLPDGARFGIIASTTSPFCRRCDRARLTADGMWYTCLYARTGLDLRRLVRSGAQRGEIRSAIEEAWKQRSDRGAENRKAQASRGIFVPLEQLRRDPHLEMHTRGG